MISEKDYKKLLKGLPADGIAVLQAKFKKSRAQIYRDLRNGADEVVFVASELAAKEKQRREGRKQKTSALIKQL